MSTIGMEEEDPVVGEIDVYISTNLMDSLSVVQYPTRPTYRPLELPAAAKVKPESGLLRFLYNIDCEGECYDTDAEEYLKLKRKPMQSTAVPSTTNYAIGVFRDGQLHLTSLSTLHQMKPCFDYIDDAANDPDVMGIDIDDENDNSKNALKPLQIEYKRRDNRSTSKEQQSHAAKKQMEMSESWIDLKVNPTESTYTADEFELLFCEAGDPIEFKLPVRDYLRVLKHSDETILPNPSLKNGLTFDVLDGMTGDLQVLELLKTAQVLRFETIRSFATHVANDETLLQILQPISTLIQGCFVMKSECYYSKTLGIKDEKKNEEGFQKERKEKIMHRDAILLKLEANGYVSKVEIAKVLGLSYEVVEEILKDICILNTKQRLWRLKLPKDEEFLNQYLNFASEQTSKWLNDCASIYAKYPGLLKT